MSGSVAVVVRVGDDEKRVARALRSVLGQTHTQWNLVLALESGDVADTVEKALAAEGVRDDARIHTVTGAPGTRRGALANVAIDTVESDHVVLHDDDGSWEPGFLERTVAHLDAHPDDVGVATRVEVAFEREEDGQTREVRRETLAQDDRAASLVSLIWGNFVPPVSLLFRRSAFEAAGRYDETLAGLEDWDLLLRLLVRGPLGFLPEETLATWYLADPDEGDDERDEAARRARDLDELAVRDRFLRRDLAGSAGGTTGLGVPLALARQLRAVTERSDRAGAELAQVLDRWGHAHQDHVDVVTTELRIEVSRLRGEMLLLRENLDEVQEDVYVVSEQLQQSMETLTTTIEAAVRSVASRPAPPQPPARRSLARRVAGRVRRSVRRSPAKAAPSAEPPAALEAPSHGRAPGRATAG